MTHKPDRRIIFDIGFSPGDIVVFTGAIRDLKLAFPDYLLSVQTCCPAIFEHNPHLINPPAEFKPPDIQPVSANLQAAGFDAGDLAEFEKTYYRLMKAHTLSAQLEGGTWNYYDVKQHGKPEGVLFTLKHDPNAPRSVEFYAVQYEDIHNCGDSGRHFSNAYNIELEQLLRVKFKQTSLLPDIHLSKDEKAWTNQVEEMTGYRGPFWLINAGHKADYPLKSWGYQRWQRLVNLLSDRVQFVQVGELSEGHTHYKLDNAIDLRGKTDLRQFIRLCYHAQGAVTPISLLMHLMAAWQKPCVTVAGGREPRRWEQYPSHRYLDTCGCLPCCAYNGCWLSGKREDNGENKTCKVIVGGRAKCMAMITPEAVAREVNLYFEGGIL